MVYNIYVYLSYATSPRTLISKLRQRKNGLHHQSEPVPGIYMHDMDGTHLVAMKPKSGPGFDSALFVPRTGFDSPREPGRQSLGAPFALPRRESTLSTLTMNSTMSTETSVSSLEKPHGSSVTSTDLGGYRTLRHPHYVEWNNIHARYMFSEEVSLRSIQVPMCRNRSCQQGGAECACDKNKSVQRGLFLLDDDFSYALIKGDMTKRDDKRRLAEGLRLWCFDRDTGLLRQQTPEESAVNIHRMRNAEPRFLCQVDRPTFMKVVKYASRKDRVEPVSTEHRISQ